jgi:hypothetical protein
LSSKTVDTNGTKFSTDNVDNDAENDVDNDDSSASLATSNVLVVVAKTPIKAFTQFGPLQVTMTQQELKIRKDSYDNLKIIFIIEVP